MRVEWLRPSAGVRRALAVAILLVLVAALASGWRYASARRAAAVPREVPYALGDLEGVTADGVQWRFPSGAPRPTVLIYASPTCGHCRAELERWAAAAAMRPDLLARVDVVVIAPGAVAETTTLVPPGLVARHVADGGGRIARALALRAVPFEVFVAPDGTALEQAVGETGVDVILARVARLVGSAG
jgi:hypothetical protein